MTTNKPAVAGRPGWREPVVAMGAVVAALTLAGVPPLAAARAALAVAWVVLVPGIAIATGLRPGGGTSWGMAAVLGAAAIGPVYTIAVIVAAPLIDPGAIVLLYPVPMAIWHWRTLRRLPAGKPEPFDGAPWLAAAPLAAYLLLVYLPAFGELPDGGLQLTLREPLLNARASFFHVVLAGQFGVERRLLAPFAADYPMTLFHLHAYAQMAMLDRLSGAGPLIAEFRLFPVFSTLLAFVGLRAVLPLLGVPRAAASRAAVLAFLGSPVLVLFYGVLPQTILALVFFAAAAALAAAGLARSRTTDLIAGGVLFGIGAQVEIQWMAVIYPGIMTGLLWPGSNANRRNALRVLLSAGMTALALTSAGLLATGWGSGAFPVVVAPGAFAAAAFARFRDLALEKPALWAVAAAGAVLCAAGIASARHAWGVMAPAARRVFIASAACAIAAPLFLHVPEIPSMTVNFAVPAFAAIAVLAAVGLAALRGLGARALGATLVLATFAMAAAALGLPADTASMDRVDRRSLEELRAGTGVLDVVAARDRTPAEALLWEGVARRRAAGWVLGPDMASRYEAIFRTPGLLARVQRVQNLLETLPAAGGRAEAAAILSEIGAPVVEIPLGAAGAPALDGLLDPVAAGRRSGYYRVNAFAGGR